MGESMTTSKITLAAAAGLLLGLSASAKAADLGSGCCADLEERVAELESTTARKGNRVVSLQVYGQVNRALLIWDDGEDSDIFSVDGSESGSRFGFIGSASIKPGWTAGYKIEVNARASEQSKVDQNGDVGDDTNFSLAHSYLWIESEQLGRLTLGKTDAATDAIDDIVLANVLQGRGTNEGSFLVRGAGGAKLGDFVNSFTGGNDDLVRYDSPSIAGFIISASWVDQGDQKADQFDVTLRYSGEFNAFRIAAGIGYSVLDADGSDDRELVAGSASIMHVPTGLFVAFGTGEQDNLTNPDDKSFYHVTSGIEKNFFGYGATTIYGEYGQYDDFQDDATGSDAEVFGFGIVQQIDSAAMDVYAQYRNYNFDDGTAADLEDFSSILVGSRIKF